MFSNLTNKLQSTLSNLADPHHAQQNPQSGSGTPPPAGNPSSYGTHALDQLTHSLRSLQVQYSPSVPPSLRPLQLLITGEKTLALAYESVAQSARNSSRDLYFWGQEGEDDVRDVSDRLAWLLFTSGTLASTLSTTLSGDARQPLKQLREAEQLLAPRKAARAAAQAQLQRAQSPQERAELERAIKQGEAEDFELEARVRRARREGLREAERAKWKAVREYADKLLLLCRGAEELLELVPPTTTGAPSAAGVALAQAGEYKGAQKSADIKSAVQDALDTYTPGQLEPLSLPAEGLSRAASDRRSFGETHAGELANTSGTGPAQLNTSASETHSSLAPPTSGTQAPPPSAILPQPGRFVAPIPGLANPSTNSTQPSTSPSHGTGPVAPAPGLSAQPGTSPLAGKPTSPLAQHTVLASSPPPDVHSPPPLNPSALNQAPAPLPPPTTTTSPVLSPSSRPSASLASVAASASSGPAAAGGAGFVLPDGEGTTTTTGAVPTIAETGVPISGSGNGDGPGPKQGSLRRDDLHPGSPPTSYNPPAGVPPSFGSAGAAAAGGVGATGGGWMSAEEEKRALERAERDRILAGQSTSGSGSAAASGSGYQTTYAPYQRHAHGPTQAQSQAQAQAQGQGQGQTETESERAAREEKRRLEREERERILRGQGGGGYGGAKGDDDLPPSYSA